MTLALNIPGAGAGGIVSCGMLKRIHELGIKPKMAFGTSSGALNLALFAQGDLDILENLWMTIENHDIRGFSLCGLLDKPPHQYSSDPLLRLLRSVVDLGKLQNCGIACYVTTADTQTYLTTRYRIDKPQKDVCRILTASASLPGLFPVIDGQYDGGLVDNFNLQEAIELGADEIIMLMPNRPPVGKLPRTGFDVFELIVGFPEWSNYRHQLQILDLLPAEKRPKFTAVVPKESTRVPLFDFSYNGFDRKALIQLGYSLVKETIG